MVEQKVALVTGNYKGIGKAISERLIDLGFKEPMLIRSQDYNLKNYFDCQKLVNDVVSRFGKIDLLVNNVGNFIKGHIDEFSIEDWHEMMDSNLNSAFYLSKLSIPFLRQTQGKIINLGYAGLQRLSPSPNVFAYEAAKTALLVLTKAMAKAEIVNQVTVNMISPGSLENTVDKEITIKNIPLGRLGRIEELIQAMELCLANDYITGQNIEIAGGKSL